MSSLHPNNVHQQTAAKSDLRTFKEDLTHAIADAFPTGRMPYKHVRAVLARWDADNTHADQSVNAVQQLFEEYGYDCKEVIIPADSPTINPQFFLQEVLYKLGREGEAGDLTIFYYAGHGVWDDKNQLLRLQ